jgi:hypothetical protein
MSFGTVAKKQLGNLNFEYPFLIEKRFLTCAKNHTGKSLRLIIQL